MMVCNDRMAQSRSSCVFFCPDAARYSFSALTRAACASSHSKKFGSTRAKSFCCFASDSH